MTSLLPSIVTALFLGVVVAQAPSEWTCDPSYYDANDECHCNCGVYDPDCDVQPVCYCGNAGICGICISKKFISFNDTFVNLKNQLTGSIPSEIGMLSSLTTLELQNNHLTGSIPSEIGMLSSLLFL